MFYKEPHRFCCYCFGARAGGDAAFCLSQDPTFSIPDGLAWLLVKCICVSEPLVDWLPRVSSEVSVVILIRKQVVSAFCSTESHLWVSIHPTP